VGYGKSSGAFAFALNFLLLFLSKRKRRKLQYKKWNINTLNQYNNKAALVIL